MRRGLVYCVSGLLIMAASATHTAQAERQGVLFVENSTPLRSDRGSFRCALWVSSSGFPESFKAAARLAVAKPTRGRARCAFRGLAPGRYAVSVLHDENDNLKMDTNLFGIPQEGYGVSNNAPPGAMSAPKWRDAVFHMRSASATLRLLIRY